MAFIRIFHGILHLLILSIFRIFKKFSVQMARHHVDIALYSNLSLCPLREYMQNGPA